MNTQSKLKYTAKEKGYFIDIIHHTRKGYTKKVEFVVTNLLGETIYNKTFRWTQNADYEYEVLDFVSNLPANDFKVITESDNIDMLLHNLMNDEEPEEISNYEVDIWDLFESEAA